MKSLAVVSFFSLAALVGLPVGAQTVAPPSPVMTESAPPPFQPAPQVQPTEARPGGRTFPPQDPQDFADNQAAEAQPLPLWEGDDQAVAGMRAPQTTPQPQYDPGNSSDPGDPNLAFAPPDLGPDNDIAQSYDDGYDPQAYTQFQGDLAPYGSWSNDPTYGNVWSPYSTTVGADFVPYASCGHWLMSEYGWTWVSDWNWGWAPFHYGRWITIAGRGWSWIPGTMWGPAWVSWRSGHGYVGWSPLPPRGTRLFAGNGGRSPWRFTTAAGLGAAHPSFVSSRYLPSLFAHTTVVANDRLLTRGQWNVHVNAGPTRGMSATPVHLSTAAPRALPHVAIYPHAGVALSARPWTNARVGNQRSTGQGWSGSGSALHPLGAYGQGGHPQAGYVQGAHPQGGYVQGARPQGGYVQGARPQGGNGQGWNAGAAPQRAVGRTPAYGPAAARPEARAPATTWSRPSQSYYGSASSYGRPNAGTSYPPAARPYAAPSYGSAQPSYHPPAAAPAYNRAPAQSYAPAQRSYAPPAAHFGGGSSFGGGSHSGGGGSSFGGGGGSHFGGGGGGHRR